jgi:hypothetical protein
VTGSLHEGQGADTRPAAAAAPCAQVCQLGAATLHSVAPSPAPCAFYTGSKGQGVAVVGGQPGAQGVQEPRLFQGTEVPRPASGPASCACGAALMLPPSMWRS